MITVNRIHKGSWHHSKCVTINEIGGWTEDEKTKNKGASYHKNSSLDHYTKC